MRYFKKFEELCTVSNDFGAISHKTKTTILTNCVNCGAVLKHDECEYCGTKYTKETSIDARGELKSIKNRYNESISEAYVEYIANKLDPEYRTCCSGPK